MRMIQNDRIQLRAWCLDDAAVLFRHASDPEVGPRAGWPPHRSVEESREIIRTLFSNDHTWAIVKSGQADGERQAVWPDGSHVVGCIGYYLPGESNIDIGPNDAEVGYWVARPYWNRGIATDALRLVVDHCFRQKGFQTLWADYFPDNPASGRVMQKCGFRDTGLVNRCSRLQLGGDKPVHIMRLDRNDG